MDGWLAASGAAYIRSGRNGPPAAPVPGGARADRRTRPQPARSTSRWSRRTCRTSPSRGDTEAGLAASPGHRPGPADATGRRHAERVGGLRRRSTSELDVIEGPRFPGYFLIVHDIVAFCEKCASSARPRVGRGASAVYSRSDHQRGSRSHGLLFERFLLRPGQSRRHGPDIEHHRRERCIQYVYGRDGRGRQRRSPTWSHRSRMAITDAGRALTREPAQLDPWAKQVGQRGFFPRADNPVDDDVSEPRVAARRADAALPPPPRHSLGGM